MPTLLQFELPATKRFAKLAARLSENRLSHPETTGVITTGWSCSEHKERIDQIAAVASRMQDWMNEAAIIEATSKVKPVGRREIARFMKLKDMLETDVNLFEEADLPKEPQSRGI